MPIFRDVGIDSICLIHELPGVIRKFCLEKQAAQIAEHAKAVVFPAQIVADGFSQFARVDADKQIIRPQGLYRKTGGDMRRLQRDQSFDGDYRCQMTLRLF